MRRSSYEVVSETLVRFSYEFRMYIYVSYAYEFLRYKKFNEALPWSQTNRIIMNQTIPLILIEMDDIEDSQWSKDFDCWSVLCSLFPRTTITYFIIPTLFFKATRILWTPPSVCLSDRLYIRLFVTYLLLNHWADFYLTCCITSLHDKGVLERHYFSMRASVRESVVRPFVRHTISS